MPLTLTPEQEQRITTYARQKQKPVERVIDEWVHTLPAETPETETLPQESKSGTAQTAATQPIAKQSAAEAVGALEEEDDWNAPCSLRYPQRRGVRERDGCPCRVRARIRRFATLRF